MHVSLNWRDVERMAAAQLGVINIGFAISILVGGAQRFPPPTYQPLLDATGERVWPYAIMFAVPGLLLVLPHYKAIFLGHVLGVVAMNVFAGMFAVALVENPTSGATAWWAYFCFGTLHGFNIALMAVRRSQKLYDEGGEE